MIGRMLNHMINYYLVNKSYETAIGDSIDIML